MHLLPTITVPGFPYFSHLIVLVEMWRRGPEVWRSKGLEPVEGSGEGQITCRILDIYHLSNGCPGNTVSATVFSRFMFTDQLPSGREYLSHWPGDEFTPSRGARCCSSSSLKSETEMNSKQRCTTTRTIHLPLQQEQHTSSRTDNSSFRSRTSMPTR